MTKYKYGFEHLDKISPDQKGKKDCERKSESYHLPVIPRKTIVCSNTSFSFA